MSNATEQQAEAAIKLLKQAIEAAKNSNQAGENAVVRAAAALREAEQRPAPQWRPIATAPFDGTSVLLFTTDHGVVEARYEPGRWCDGTPDHSAEYDGAVWVCGDDAFQIEIEERDRDPARCHHGTATHWMPLPEPPGEKASDHEAATPPPGWKLVPVEPTQELTAKVMRGKMHNGQPIWSVLAAAGLDANVFWSCHKAMIDAAPEPPEDEQMTDAIKAALPKTSPDEWVEKMALHMCEKDGDDWAREDVRKCWRDNARAAYAALRPCVVGE